MMGEPLVITAAPNGARRTRADHPALPLTADELAATARECLVAGAAMIHLHVRDAAGRHLLDVDAYRTACRAVQGSVGDELLIQVTTEAVGRYTPTEQMALVQALRPEAVSLALCELAPDASAEEDLARFSAWMGEQGVMPQWILYSADDVQRYRQLCSQGVLPDHGGHGVLFVLGRYVEGQRAEPRELIPFLNAAAGLRRWTVCAFGPQEHLCCAAGAALGGHVRVGFENCLWLRDGRLAPDNAALVREMALTANALGRPLASASTLRTLWQAD